MAENVVAALGLSSTWRGEREMSLGHHLLIASPADIGVHTT